MNKLKTTLTAVAALLASTVANAAPIQFWDFTTVTVFGDSVFTATGGGTQDAVPGNTLVSWGAEGGDHTDNTQTAANSRSALEVTESVVNGTMEIGGPAQDSGEVTHYNNAISSTFKYLTNTQIDTKLTLFALPQPGLVIGPLEKVFSVNFIETFNEDEPEDCGFESVSACDDIFVVELGDLDFSFTVGGYLYTVTIGRQGLLDLPDATCEEAGALAGCFGVTTQEGLFTPVNFDLSIDAKLIPEPSALALLGIGLFGLGVARRRMSK